MQGKEVVKQEKPRPCFFNIGQNLTQRTLFVPCYALKLKFMLSEKEKLY